MSESFRTTPPQQPWSNPNSAGNGSQGTFGSKPAGDGQSETDVGDVGKALLVGLLGGLLSAAGYMVYRRLPEEQKEKINTQVRTIVQQRISEIRQNFNI